jgi:ABC-type phosphate/phosphonate transport system permease subunit
MDKRNTIVLIIILSFFLYLYFSNKHTFENFTQEQQQLAQILLQMFKKQEIPTFTKYLNILIHNKNTNDNLISKDVFNKLYNNKNISIQDILNEMNSKIK